MDTENKCHAPHTSEQNKSIRKRRKQKLKNKRRQNNAAVLAESVALKQELKQCKGKVSSNATKPGNIMYINQSDIVVDDKQSIGEGSFGVCYSGHYGPHRIVVKSVSSKSVLNSECRYLSKLRHPNLPILFGICHENCSLVLSFHGNVVTGSCVNMQSFVRQSRKNAEPFSSKINSLFLDILSALIYLHQEQVLHNDLKLDNVVVHTIATKYTGILIDFGKSSSTSTTRKSGCLSPEEQQRRLRTYRHIAPEIYAENQSPSVLTDVY